MLIVKVQFAINGRNGEVLIRISCDRDIYKSLKLQPQLASKCNSQCKDMNVLAVTIEPPLHRAETLSLIVLSQSAQPIIRIIITLSSLRMPMAKFNSFLESLIFIVRPSQFSLV